jgi:hypothetical protein
MLDLIHLSKRVLKEIETCDETWSRPTDDSWPVGRHYRLNVYLTHLGQGD